MASLPSVITTTNTIKLESDFKKRSSYFPSFEKKNVNLDKGFDVLTLDYDKEIETSAYVPLLQKCIEKNSLQEAHTIHGHIVKSGRQDDLFVMTSLVNVYGKCGAMEDARKVFDTLSKRNVVTWTSLMSGYVYNLQAEEGVRVFLEMLRSGSYPTNYTIGVVLNACCALLDAKLGKEVHGYVVKYGLEDDTSIGNSLCNLYSKCRGNLDSAMKAFWRIEERNVISWTTVVSACGENGNAADGLGLFCAMLEEDVEPNEFILTSVLSLCCTMQAIDVGLQVHSLSIKIGYQFNLPVANSTMYLYLKGGLYSEAKKLFYGLEKVSLVTWNAMIAGYAQMMDVAENSVVRSQNGAEALDIFLRLQRSGLKPDLFTMSSVLTVCSNLVALEQGEQIHAQTIKTGYLADVVVGTALVNMYSKCGSIKKASKAFVEMNSRTLISWTSMITAFAQHGLARQALDLFNDMRLAGDRPNKVTFVGVLAACSHAGMVDEGLRYFEMMKSEYKITPIMDHYGCIIDMFVRLGRLEDAFDFVKKMEFEPNEFIWSLLVAGCRSHGNLELGFYAAEQLLSLNPKDPELYIMLLNMYVSAGKWKDVSRLRKIMKDEKITKPRDWSWISIKDKVYSFKQDDKSCYQCHEVHGLLGDLLEKSRNLGFEWKENLDIPENEEIEDREPSFSRAHHSEKYAVVFGLLKIQKPSPIRVVKSMGMCSDCHSFIKFVSVLTEREIMVRDNKRLHRFVHGKCSCGDFGSLL
uniref:putative pentatricopeptide repeat-containing protein At5g52630 n=1 Tax=Erigeron canadensis TaxID=72917 RepID=UPI001CB8BE23|nr:putative pentatricopeptide repeat-containing protein At5g52630 [Erigeron canadensis]